jgi:hypothetical protein
MHAATYEPVQSIPHVIPQIPGGYITIRQLQFPDQLQVAQEPVMFPYIRNQLVFHLYSEPESLIFIKSASAKAR